MYLMRTVTLGLAIGLFWLGTSSCSQAEDHNKDNPCQNLKYGYNHTGFVGCDPTDAFARLNEVAKQGDGEALYVLALIYDEGGVRFGLPDLKPNGELAEKYYLQSARKGYAEAQARISTILWKESTDSSQKASLYWACKAAMQNNYSATVNIQDQIATRKSGQTVQQFCDPILKSPPQHQ